LKFGHLFQVEWHERLPVQCSCDSRWVKPLFDNLHRIDGAQTDAGTQTKISHAIQEITSLIPACFTDTQPAQCACETSILEVVERMELFIWSRGYSPRSNLSAQWNAVFNNRAAPPSPEGIISAWYHWTWYQEDFPRFVQNDYHENIFRYILREYEAHVNNGANIHFDKHLQLDHIFPQNPQQFPPHGFADPDDYRAFLNRIGNLVFAPDKANRSWSNSLPDAKALVYAQLTTPMIARRVGTQLVAFGTHLPAHRHALEIRCTELALFSLKRFNAQCIPQQQPPA